MGGVLHEGALAGGGVLEPVEHLVQGAGERAELVIRPGDGQRPGAALAGHVLGGAAQLVHGVQGTAEGQPDRRGEEEGEGGNHTHEGEPQGGEDALDVAQRHGHHHRHFGAPPAGREDGHPRQLVVGGAGGAAVALETGEVGGPEHGERAARVRGGGHDPAPGVEDLRHLTRLHRWQRLRQPVLLHQPDQSARPRGRQLVEGRHPAPLDHERERHRPDRQRHAQEGGGEQGQAQPQREATPAGPCRAHPTTR